MFKRQGHCNIDYMYTCKPETQNAFSYWVLTNCDKLNSDKQPKANVLEASSFILQVIKVNIGSYL